MNPFLFVGTVLIFLSLLFSGRCGKSLKALQRIELVGGVGFGFVLFAFVAESIHYIPFYWALGIAITIGAIVGITAFWSHITRDIIFSWPIRRKIAVREPPKIKETIIDVYDQNDLPSWSELFRNTEREIVIQGVTVETLNRVRTSIESAVKQGKRVRILLCHPETPIMTEIETLVVSINTKSRIQSCVNMMYQTKDNLGSSDKQNLEIKWHKQIPTMSLVIMDESMQIEPYTYNTPQDKRKKFKINRKDQRNLFDVYHKAFENLWNDATPAERSTPKHFF
jgi:hypothetical protein